MAQHIWVIEDDDSIAEVMQLVLEQEGYEVHVSTNYAVEREIIATWPQPALILLDVLMSGSDGREVAKELRAQSHLASIPMFFVSANIAIEKRAQEAGVNGYLRKPFNIDDLISLVRDNAIEA